MYLRPLHNRSYPAMKSLLKKFIPGRWLDYYAKYKYHNKISRFQNLEAREVFERIYRDNLWGSRESRSGPGSSHLQALQIAPEFRKALDRAGIQSILDAPCGDFNWMSVMDLSGISYTGIDVVGELIENNLKNYSRPEINFIKMDLLRDDLPKADLILNRDCLVHFAYQDVDRALKNMIRSGSSYLMTTTFPGQRLNFDITTGDWRPLNLERGPFHFPKPLITLPEPVEKKYALENKGKMLAVWDLKSLEKHLENHVRSFK